MAKSKDLKALVRDAVRQNLPKIMFFLIFCIVISKNNRIFAFEKLPIFQRYDEMRTF